MKGFIETITGRYAGTTIALEDGAVCNVGSELGNDLFFPNDYLLAPLHFVISNEDHSFILKGITDNLFVNNEPIKETKLAHGDFIFAGETLLYFSIDGEKTLSDTPLGKLTSVLTQLEKLYLLIDENSDNRILPLLKLTKSKYIFLKDSIEKLDYLTANPLLVFPPKEHLETFVRTFWGQGKLIFLELNKDQDDTIFHLKKLLFNTQTKERIDIRFYDPRMLRTILGETEKKHAQHFFAGVKRYFVESQIPSQFFEFSRTEHGVNAKVTRLTKATAKIPTQIEIEKILAENSLNSDLREKTTLCLQHLLVGEENNFQTKADKFLPIGEGFGLQTVVAKIQFVALNYLIDSDLDFNKLFSPNGFSSDEKLDFLVDRINMRRG